MSEPKKHKQIKTVIPHIIAWMLILLVNIATVNPYNLNEENGYLLFVRANILVWIVYFLFFYINYLLLIPHLLFRSHRIVYVLSTLLLLSGSFAIIKDHKQQEYRAYLTTRLSEREESLRQARINEQFAAKTPTGTNEYTSEVEKLKRTVDRLDKRLLLSHGVRNYNPLRPENGAVFFGLLLILTSAIALQYIHRAKERGEEAEQQEKQRIATELAYLKQQINPHFLFNALNTVYSLVLPHDEKASDAIVRLSSILRYMLYETDKKKVPLDKEIEIVTNYIALWQLKLDDRTKINFIFEGDSSGSFIEPMILFPIIENAFKHGADGSEGSFVEIHLSVADGQLSMEARNSIVHPTEKQTASGIGLKNITRRLQLAYPHRHELRITTEGAVYSLQLSIQLS